jgi:hypothetical protein
MDALRQQHFDNLLRDLREGTSEQRLKAAKALRDGGAQAIEPLCLALHDEDANVRIAAAKSLGHAGDDRAVQPLVEALKRCFVGHSFWRQMLVSFVVCVVSIGLAIAFSDMSRGKSFIVAIFFILCQMLASGIWGVYYTERRAASKTCSAIAEALTSIVERTPTPELRAILPQLKAIAIDVVHQDKHTRAASRQAAQRIEALTEQLKSLPLPASAPAPDNATLPRIADAPPPNVETLPRISSANERE